MAKARRIQGIVCDGSAVAGVKTVLTERFDEMRTLRRAALDWKDPEGVHSMRVASRRLRSALRDFTPYLNKRGLNSVVKQMKGVADALGEVRDEDVAIMELEKLASDAPHKVSAALLELAETRKEVRQKARAKLKSTIDKEQIRQLELNFETTIADATTSRGHNAPSLTYNDMAKAIIRDRLNELMGRSNGLYRPLEAEPLHDMRIAVKRLRYAIELFQECLGQFEEPFAKNLANLQTELGSIHDCDVWIENLGKQIIEAKRLKEQNEREALVWLLNHFAEVRNKHLSESLSLWSKWESDELTSKLQEAIK